jgi:hypothetical protein
MRKTKFFVTLLVTGWILGGLLDETMVTIITSVMAGIASLYLSYRGATLFLQWWLEQRRAVQASEQSVSDNPPLPVLLERLRPELPWPPENWEQMLDEFLSRHPEPSATNEESKHLANWGTTYYRQVPVERRQACHCFDMRVRTFRVGTAEAVCVCGHRESEHSESGCTVVAPRPVPADDKMKPNNPPIHPSTATYELSSMCIVCEKLLTFDPGRQRPPTICPNCAATTTRVLNTSRNGTSVSYEPKGSVDHGRHPG